VKKVRMMRLLGQRTGTCFQRCVGLDALNGICVTSYDIDEKYGTKYYEHFRAFLRYVQENDLMSAGAMSDPKGDRSLRPHEQDDPDVYLRVVERPTSPVPSTPTKSSPCPPGPWGPRTKTMPSPSPFLWIPKGSP
jgi:aromatic ring hydroxylase